MYYLLVSNEGFLITIASTNDMNNIGSASPGFLNNTNPTFVKITKTSYQSP